MLSESRLPSRAVSQKLPFLALTSFALASPASLAAASQDERRVPSFVDVAPDVGFTATHVAEDPACLVLTGSGAAWADYDGDHDLDVFMTSLGGPNRLYRNEGDLDKDGLPDFVDVAEPLGIAQAARLSHATVFIDYDNDGDQDLYVTHKEGGNTLWRNLLIELGEVAFHDTTELAGLADEGRAITASWADFDNDGFLDLYLAKHAICLTATEFYNSDALYRSNGDGTFEDWSRYLCEGGESVDCNLLTRRLGFSAGWFDYDNDGDQDLYLVNDSVHGYGGNVHWRNDGPDGEGGWIFTEVGREAGTDVRLNGMGLGIGDFDNDGWLDLSFSNIAESKLLRNNRDGTYQDHTNVSGVEAATLFDTGWGTVFFDANNDGWLDLYFVNGSLYGGPSTPNTLMLNTGGPEFENATLSCGLGSTSRGRSASIADFDGDGWVDVLIGNLGQMPELFRNTTDDEGLHWLTVTVEGTKSNRDAIGTRVWAATPEAAQIREISTGPTHGGGDHRAAYFGLGSFPEAKLWIRWPSGLTQNLGLVRADRHLHFVEPLSEERPPLQGFAERKK